jgi:hypothetical protein
VQLLGPTTEEKQPMKKENHNMIQQHTSACKFGLVRRIALLAFESNVMLMTPDTVKRLFLHNSTSSWKREEVSNLHADRTSHHYYNN